MTHTWILSIALAAVLSPAALSGNCDGDSGFVLTAPPHTGIGEYFDMCFNAPAGNLVAVLASLGQGPTVTPYGTLCIDFPPLVVFTFEMPAGGGRCFHRYTPCDPTVVGWIGYLQFVALDGSGNPTGISNQVTMMVMDNGACG